MSPERRNSPPAIDPEDPAQKWHEGQDLAGPGHEQSSCWCCCPSCDPDWGGDNPYYVGAQAAQAAGRAAWAMKQNTPTDGRQNPPTEDAGR